MLRNIGLIAVAVGIALAGVVQFVPSAAEEFSAGGGSVESKLLPWGLHTESSSAFGSDEDKTGFFNSDMDDLDGIDEFRAQEVIGYVGAGLALLGLLYAALKNPRGGAIAVLVGGVLALVALILFAVGADKASSDGFTFDLVTGFYLQIVSCVGYIVGAVLIHRN